MNSCHHKLRNHQFALCFNLVQFRSFRLSSQRNQTKPFWFTHKLCFSGGEGGRGIKYASTKQLTGALKHTTDGCCLFDNQGITEVSRTFESRAQTCTISSTSSFLFWLKLELAINSIGVKSPAGVLNPTPTDTGIEGDLKELLPHRSLRVLCLCHRVVTSSINSLSGFLLIHCSSTRGLLEKDKCLC